MAQRVFPTRAGNEASNEASTEASNEGRKPAVA